jgi:uncharacterized membrane protein required for colicin V production
MLDFVRKVFRGGLEVILWVNLILYTIVGGVVGYFLGRLISYRNADGYVFLGIIVGIVIGLLFDIIMGGFIATILNMDKNLELLVKEEVPSKVGNKPTIPLTDNQMKASRKCKQCGESVPTGLFVCQNCGSSELI